MRFTHSHGMESHLDSCNRSGQVRLGQVRSGQVRSGAEWMSSSKLIESGMMFLIIERKDSASCDRITELAS